MTDKPKLSSTEEMREILGRWNWQTNRDVISSPVDAAQYARVDIPHMIATIEAQATRERLMIVALERLGSSETMTVPFMIKEGFPVGDELKARMTYARDVLTALEQTNDG